VLNMLVAKLVDATTAEPACSCNSIMVCSVKAVKAVHFHTS